LESIITPGTLETLNESVDQLNIKINVSSDLYASEPVRFGPFRKLHMQIQEGTKVATEPLIARNRTGKALDAHFIDKGLLAEDHTSAIAHEITTSAFESRAMEDLNEIHKGVKESLELAKQMYDQIDSDPK
jgi:hypothetical protein